MSLIHFAPKLVSFYVFDSRYGQKEGEEHEKLLFYSPETDGINTKVRNIGLSEAFTRFTSMFNKTLDCETIHTQKHCTVMFQPEPCIWMVMKVAFAGTIKQDPHGTIPRSTNSKDTRKSRNKISNRRESGGGSSPVNIIVRKSSTTESPDLSSRTNSVNNSEINSGSVLRSTNGSSSNLTVSDIEQQTNTRDSNTSLAKDPVDSCSVNSSTSNKSANELLDQCSETNVPNTKAVTLGDKTDCDGLLEIKSSKDVCGSRESLDSNEASGSRDSTISSSVNPVTSLLTPSPVQESDYSGDGTEANARARKNSKMSSHPSTGSRSDLNTISESRGSVQDDTSSSITTDNSAAEVATAHTSRYDPSSVQATILKAHLCTAYSAFAFLHHSFEQALQQHGLPGLRKLLEAFFEDYLRRVDMRGGGVASVWRGLSFLPLSQPSFLRVYCCLAALRAAVPSIRATAFLYSSSVVWCDFDLESLRRLVYFLSYTGAFKKAEHPAAIKDDGYMHRFIGGVCGSTRVFVGRCGRGVVDLQAKGSLLGFENCAAVSSPRCASDDRKECHLVLYTCARAIIPIVLPASERLTPALYEKLARLLDSRVTQLASDLTELRGGGVGGRRISHGKPSSSTAPDGFKYIYHNKMNLATKSTVIVEREYHATGGGVIGEDLGDCCKSSTGSGGWWFNKSPAAAGASLGASTAASPSSCNVLMNGDGSACEGVVSGGAFGLGGSAVVAPVDGAAVLPWKVMQAIVDMQADMERNCLCEVVLKTEDDHWVVGRAGNGRHLFVTMAHGSANLVEISDEVQRMCNAHFGNVFMLE